MARSAITGESLQNTEIAVLSVRSDNRAATRVYEKTGYHKTGKKLWIDVGTGTRP